MDVYSVLAAFLKGIFTSQTNSSTPPVPSGVDGCQGATLEDELLLRTWNEDSSESDEGRGSADPVQDDLYTRRVLQVTHETSINTDSDKFLPKYWTPEEEAHVARIRLGSQRRPWYKKMQGFRLVGMPAWWNGFVFSLFLSWLYFKLFPLSFYLFVTPPFLSLSFVFFLFSFFFFLSPLIPGFSQKTSGSSEEDSDLDVTPWLGAPARTSPPACRSLQTL